MTQETLIDTARALFSSTFGSEPQASAYAPGRVNLLGEHTDYNGGFVLPMPLSLGTAVAIGFGGPAGTLEAASTSFEHTQTRQFDETASGAWTDYILGSVLEMIAPDQLDTGVRIAITSDLPVGSGLSSSAAVEVATIRAMSDLMGVSLDAVEIAKRARSAENNFVGMPCGIMDQYSVSVGTPGSAVFLDTRQLISNVAALPQSHAFVVIHSGVSHKLTDDGYAQRVQECAAACKALGIESLSDLGMDDLDRVAALPAPLDGRARHIVTENDRVKRALGTMSTGDIDGFAQLMNDSHASQRDDYAVSVPQVDALMEGALQAGAAGSRLTGGGFGGSIVAFVEKSRVKAFCMSIETDFPQSRIIAVT